MNNKYYTINGKEFIPREKPTIDEETKEKIKESLNSMSKGTKARLEQLSSSSTPSWIGLNY